MQRLLSIYDRLVRIGSSPIIEGLALLVTRFALAGVFWLSGRTKVEEGTWLQLSDVQVFLFESEFSAVPIPPQIAAPMSLYAETFFPILLVLGLATRFSALSLLIMTLVIQFFVFPEAWWTVHILWAALAGILISRGPGLFSVDAIIGKLRTR